MITVNPNTRQFNIPGTDLVFGVEDDSGSVIKQFQVPRYVGNDLDLTGCFIRMNYRNANGEIDTYLVQDVAVEGDNIVFGWELSPKVTMYKGNVSFVMCVVGPDTKVKWHTTLGRGQVLEGLEPDSAMIEEGTADVVAALIAMVEAQTAAVEDTGAEWVQNVQSEGTDQIIAVQTAGAEAKAAAVAEIEAKGVNVRESIPDDYTALSEAVDTLNRTRGVAIVCEAAGESVVVSDSSNLPMQGLRVFGRSTQDGVPSPEAPVEIVSVENPSVLVSGKNLLEPQYAVGTHIINNLTFTVGQDGSVTLNGTPTSSAGFVFKRLDVHEDLILTGCPTGGTTRTYRMTADCYKNGEFTETTFDLGEGLLITTNMADYVNINVFGYAGTPFNNLVFYPMVRVANDPNPTYEPYKPLQTIDTTHILRGIPVTSGGNYTDSNGQQWLCDEVDLERGVYVQRINYRVFDGTETFHIISTEENGLRVGTDWRNIPYPNSLILCSHLPNKREIPGITQGANSQPSYYVPFTTVEEWTNFLAEQSANGTPMVAMVPYDTPVETSLSETKIAAYRALHSNYPNTTVLNSAGAHMVVKYAADTKLYIDNKITALGG